MFATIRDVSHQGQYNSYRTDVKSVATFCSAMPDSPNERLKLARQAAGFDDAADFAKHFELPESTYRSAENGWRGMTVPAAKHYAKLLATRLEGVTWGYLLTGDNPPPALNGQAVRLARRSRRAERPEPLKHASLTNVSDFPRDLPVYGTALGGERDSISFDLNGQALDYVRRPPRLQNVPAAYALYMSGDSMAPWREAGQVIYVHPHQPCRPGDYVVVQIVPDEDGKAPDAYVKRLVKRTATELRLSQHNPKREIVLSIKRVLSVHRVMEWTELLGN